MAVPSVIREPSSKAYSAPPSVVLAQLEKRSSAVLACHPRTLDAHADEQLRGAQILLPGEAQGGPGAIDGGLAD